MAKFPVEHNPAMKERLKSEKTSLVGHDQTADHNCFRPVSANTLSLLPGKLASVDPVILRTLSSSPMQSMSRNSSVTSMVRVEESLEDPTFRATETTTIPRRNLTEAFEELYIEPSTTDVDTPVLRQATKELAASSVISPTGVADFNKCFAERTVEPSTASTNHVTPCKQEQESPALPHFVLHEELKRDLSDSLVDRVSFYAVIHDINKEASTMATIDDSGYNRNPEDLHEEYDPLVVAVNGYPMDPIPPSNISLIHVALVDEERWLLDTIYSRGNDESRSVKACPPTFLQAMGERDYENPLASLSNGSRTQLWKPSRSWWEAKSGKNPWIEPKSHNKRWRYLWPLIHYHKFLARCIKKLKRNGVDVKISVSPVAVFLREEVCAVSDHLAAISLFDSDRWMQCLECFSGWTDTNPEAEESLRSLVSHLKLRPLTERGDVDSPLLRSQIDEQYLRAIASARAQMVGDGLDNEGRSVKETSSIANHQSPEPKSKKHGASHSGPPPTYPRQNGSSPSFRGQFGVNSGPSTGSARRSHWVCPPHQPNWYGRWHPHQLYHYGDDASVQSAVSGEIYTPEYDMNIYPGSMFNTQYYHPHALMYPHHQPTPGLQQDIYNPTMQQLGYTAECYAPEQYDGTDWSGQTHGVAAQPVTRTTSNGPGKPATNAVDEGAIASYGPSSHFGGQVSPQTQMEGDHTPYKYNAGSPYWGHLDHSTLAMMGIASPQGMAAPHTPSRTLQSPPDGTGTETVDDGNMSSVGAQPLLLRQQYSSYGYYNADGCVPPSPATQFMMSPQANFAYGYGPYNGFSPNRISLSSPSSSTGQNCEAAMVTGQYVNNPNTMTTPSKTETGIQADIGDIAREVST